MSEPPDFFYGTAWKEQETSRLVRLALDNGFRAIDTANQRKHYFEAAVGTALKQAVADELVAWDELFIQTKFTHRGGQDQRLPYDPSAPVREQVLQSWESSLEHLHKIDSLVLHGPSQRIGLGADDKEAWAEIVRLQVEGRVDFIGVSNVTAEQLKQFCDLGSRPQFVQNRCFARQGWDARVRAICREQGIAYQGFSLLTANGRELRHPRIQEMAARRSWTPAQVVMRFALQVGMIVLTGTTDAAHMRQDLAVREGALSVEEIEFLESVSRTP